MKCKLINVDNIRMEVECTVEHKSQSLKFRAQCSSISPVRIISTHNTIELTLILDFINQDTGKEISISTRFNRMADELTDAYRKMEEAKRGWLIHSEGYSERNQSLHIEEWKTKPKRRLRSRQK